MISTKLFFEDAANEVKDEAISRLFGKIKEEQENIGFYNLPTDSDATLDKIYKFIIT